MAIREFALREDAVCADCGTKLPAGTRVRAYGIPGKWQFYGLECHERVTKPAKAQAEINLQDLQTQLTAIQKTLTALKKLEEVKS